MDTSTSDPQDYFDTIDRFWEELFNGRDLEALPELFRPDFQLHFPAEQDSEPIEGLDDLHTYLQRLQDAFPEGQAFVEGHFPAGEDHVVTSLVFEVPPPDGEEEAGAGENGELELLTYEGVAISRFQDGQIAECWFYWESARAATELEPEIKPFTWRWPPWTWP